MRKLSEPFFAKAASSSSSFLCIIMRFKLSRNMASLRARLVWRFFEIIESSKLVVVPLMLIRVFLSLLTLPCNVILLIWHLKS
jgi:hypothetical protein